VVRSRNDGCVYVSTTTCATCQVPGTFPSPPLVPSVVQHVSHGDDTGGGNHACVCCTRLNDVSSSISVAY
jgi:hypothetical protein